MQKCSLVDVWMDFKYDYGLIDAQCKMVPLNSFILQYLYHNQLTSFVFENENVTLKNI